MVAVAVVVMVASPRDYSSSASTSMELLSEYFSGFASKGGTTGVSTFVDTGLLFSEYFEVLSEYFGLLGKSRD